MAYTKVFAIRARLDDRVKYAVNAEKTELNEKIGYAADLVKTRSVRFVTALNCKSAETAFDVMRKTKEKFGKTGGVLGYHFSQSFAPGEVTPEQAHEVGCEFARRLFGNDFEVVIGTHLDKAHPHNHIVVNSVSRTDGHKYHSSPESYYNDVRGTSDALCRENDLSVITPQGKGKHYAEWKAEQGGKPTVRGIIRADIDTIIGQAYTYDSFLMLLRRNGYEVRRSPNRKYTTVKPPGAKRAIRLDSLGEGYTEADILLRLSRQRHGGMAPLIIALPVKRYRVKGKLSTVRKEKITGFHALYLRYLYLLRGGRRKKLPPKLPFSVKREVIHLERYEQQFKYLLSSGITTETELEQRIRVLEWDIRLLEEQRKPLYQERRNRAAPTSQEFITQIYKKYDRLMLFTAKKYLMDLQECEDAIQESLLKLMSRIELLRTLEEPVLTSYVVTTVRNTAINILRRQKRDAQNITSFTESVEESIIEPDSIIDIIMDREAKRSLREAIDELEPNERLLLEGKYFLGYDDRQLSELLSCAPGSIRMKLTRVRRKVLYSMQEKGAV